MSDVGVVSDLRDDVVGFVRDPSDEQKAILVAIVAIAVADRYLLWQEFPFVVRTTAAVGVGFIALFAASYLLTGRLVPPESPQALAEAMSTLSDDAIRRRLGQACVHRVTEQYGIDRTVAAYHELYDQVTGESTASTRLTARSR